MEVYLEDKKYENKKEITRNTTPKKKIGKNIDFAKFFVELIFFPFTIVGWLFDFLFNPFSYRRRKRGISLIALFISLINYRIILTLVSDMFSGILPPTFPIGGHDFLVLVISIHLTYAIYNLMANIF